MLRPSLKAAAREALPWAGLLLVVALLHFALVMGPSLLLPGSYEWLMGDDRANHYLGWSFFRHEPWRYPLGRIDRLIHPMGTTIVQTDSLPLLALFFKPISSLLPPDFQYFGLWVLLSFYLQALLGFALLRRLCLAAPAAAAGALLYLLSTAQIWRVVHMALSAHFVLLWAFLLYLRAHRERRTPVIGLVLLNLFTAAVHPYLLFLTLALSAPTYLRGLSDSPRRALMGAAALAVSLWACLHALGFFQIGSLTDRGFGAYSADLLTFVNPMRWGRLLPALPQGPGAYEGYCYLGAGTLALCLAFVGLRGHRRLGPVRPHAWFGLALLSLTMLALSSKIRMAGHLIVDLSRPYQLLGPIPGIVRSSGRLIWPAYYLLLTVVLVGVGRSLPARRAALVFLLSAGLQAFDIWPLIEDRREIMNAVHWKVPGAVTWLRAPLSPGLRALELVPPLIKSGRILCGKEWGEDSPAYYSASYLAATRGWTLNSGITSRIDEEDAKRRCEQARLSLSAPRKDTLYLVRTPPPGDRLRCRPFGSSALCGDPSVFQ